MQDRSAVRDERHEEAQHYAHDDGRDFAVPDVHADEQEALERRRSSAEPTTGCSSSRFPRARVGHPLFLVGLDAAVFLLAASSLALWSPITPLRGQTEKAGHFLHPTANAIGQSVMRVSLVTAGL